VKRALRWTAVIAGAEALARAVIPSRSPAWIVSYGALALVSGRSSGDPRGGTLRGEAGNNSVTRTVIGLGLSLFGYPLGRRILGDSPKAAPSDGLVLDLLALGIVVPLAEEKVWGTKVEPDLGVAATAALFALKHVAIDGRARRALGLAAFWTGLGLVRERSPRAAALLHCACNTGAVLRGHATGRDQF
jgi:hypothetical protein